MVIVFLKFTLEVFFFFSDAMSYFHNRHIFDTMLSKIDRDPYIQNGSVNFWMTAFTKYLKNSKDPFVLSQLDRGRAEMLCFHYK